MKTPIILTALLVVAGTTLSYAQEAKEKGEHADGDHPAAEHNAKREEMHKRFMEKFDKDGDGELSDEEKQLARKARDQARGDRGGDEGKGQERGRRGEWDRRRQEAMKRFDADGDGRFSEEERDAMRKKFGQARDTQRAKREGAESIRDLFDADADGELSAEEKVLMYESIFQITNPTGFGL